MSGSSPAVLSATVLPPVFGPVITSTRTGGMTRMSTGRPGSRRSASGSPSLGDPLVGHVAQMPPHGGNEQRMPRGAQLEPAVARESPAGCRRRASEKRARACSTSSSVAASTVRCKSAGAAPERVGQREQDAADFLGFLLLERDDVVVDLDRAERLEEQARAAAGAAVHDARNRRPVLGADDEHVAAVAIGDDLLLQVLRRVLAAQVRLERAAQPRPLLAQAIAQALQLRAGIVDDFAGGIDLAADVARSRARTRPRSRRWRASSGNAAARAGGCRGTRGVDRGEESPPAPRRPAVRARVLRRRATSGVASRSSGAWSAMSPSREEARRFGGGRERAGHRARVDQRLQPRQTRRPGGVSAKRQTASTIRSNSRALRAPACMRR